MRSQEKLGKIWGNCKVKPRPMTSRDNTWFTVYISVIEILQVPVMHNIKFLMCFPLGVLNSL